MILPLIFTMTIFHRRFSARFRRQHQILRKPASTILSLRRFAGRTEFFTILQNLHRSASIMTTMTSSIAVHFHHLFHHLHQTVYFSIHHECYCHVQNFHHFEKSFLSTTNLTNKSYELTIVHNIAFVNKKQTYRYSTILSVCLLKIIIY